MFEFEWFSEQISRLRPWHLRPREQLMSLAFCTRYIDDLWNPLVEETTFRSVTAQMYPDWLPLHVHNCTCEGTGSQGTGDQLLGHEHQT